MAENKEKLLETLDRRKVSFKKYKVMQNGLRRSQGGIQAGQAEECDRFQEPVLPLIGNSASSPHGKRKA